MGCHAGPPCPSHPSPILPSYFAQMRAGGPGERPSFARALSLLDELEERRRAEEQESLNATRHAFATAEYVFAMPSYLHVASNRKTYW